MSTLHFEMSNCYGIKRLSHDFPFNNTKHTHLIYAPNGSMKTSFAKTMRYLSKQVKDKPRDLLYDDIAHKGIVKVEIDNENINSHQIFVADGDDDLDSGQTFVNFLASSSLKANYDRIYNSLTEQKNALMNRLEEESRSSDCEEELFSTFKQGERDTIFSVLERLSSGIDEELPVFDFKYNDIFDKKDKIKSFLEKNKEYLERYFNQYNQLISSSTIFRNCNGHTFGTFQASQLESSVSDGNFFGVEHKIVLHEGTEINTSEELKTIISTEKERIFNDEELRKTFESITNALDKNVELRTFKAILEAHPDWIVEMIDFENFKKKVWKGHLSKPELKNLLNNFNSAYQENKEQLQIILSDAEKEQSRWRDIVDIYNDRFDVPFRVKIENQRDIILKKEAAKLQFSYKENSESYIPKDKETLMNILSRGEKRAFHIMQLLFELEARKEEDYTSLIVLDDIADSFDYQNKYAIIEYIKDFDEKNNGKFMLLIMTHNFDFYRTVASRLSLPQKTNMWMVIRNDDGNVELKNGQYKGNIFLNVFVGHDDDNKIFISMIPYVRNLIEYTKCKNHPDFLKLTSCMHLKEDTGDITEEEIIDIMAAYTRENGMRRAKTKTKVYDTIMNTADAIVKEESANPIIIQNKIVLSIAARLLAEKYMKNKLSEAGMTKEELQFEGVQTGKLTGLYKRILPDDSNKDIIERVNMMTPEFIHLNSFMYEPLIDMSLKQLIRLYNSCKDKLNVE